MIGRLKGALIGAAIVAGLSVSSVASADSLARGLSIRGPVPSGQPVHFQVVLPFRNQSQLDALLAAQQDPKSAQYHKWLTPAQFNAQFGPTSADLARASAYLKSQGFSVQTHSFSVYASGRADQVTRTFGMPLMTARTHLGQNVIVSTKNGIMPNALAPSGAQLIGFAPLTADFYSARATGRIDTPSTNPSPFHLFWFDDLKQAYQFPANNVLNGAGTTIAIVMQGDVLDSDIKAMFDHENWSSVSGTPDPTLFGRVYIDGAVPGDHSNPDAFGEASLDTQSSLGNAPGAHVVLYDLPTLSFSDIFDAYTAIINANNVDVVSSSFGTCELFFFPGYNGGADFRGTLLAFHQLFQQGNAQGVTFLTSSGDAAFSGGGPGAGCPQVTYFSGNSAKSVPSVSTFADDPNVTGVGGTNLLTTALTGTSHPGPTSVYVGENDYSDPLVPLDPFGTGGVVSGLDWGAAGGISQLFPRPAFQTSGSTPSTTWRTVPDIGMQVGGCPGGVSILAADGNCNGGNNVRNGSGNEQRSAAIIVVNGSRFGFIGTSDSTPEFAGAVADLVEASGRQGNLNTYIYSQPSSSFHTPATIPGFNGLQNCDFSATYSICTGRGTPKVNVFINPGSPPAAAGNPQTSTNP